MLTVGALAKLLAPTLFRVVERTFGPKSGKTKQQTVFDALMVVLRQAAAAGGEAVPADSEVFKMLEGLLAEEKASPTWRERGTLSVGSKTYIVDVIGELK